MLIIIFIYLNRIDIFGENKLLTLEYCFIGIQSIENLNEDEEF